MNQKANRITFTKRQAIALCKQIVSQCEQAYRRGAQQAVASGLTEADAAWYRNELIDIYRGYFFHLKAHRMPSREGTTKENRTYARKSGRGYSAVDMHLNIGGGKAYSELRDLVQFSEVTK